MKVKSPIYVMSGPLKFIGAEKKITDKFTIREIYMDFDDSYEKDGNHVEKPSTPKFQVSGRDLPALEHLKPGDWIHFSFKVTGRTYEKNELNTNGEKKKGHITSLEAWNIKKLINLVENKSTPITEAELAGDPADDLPF